MTEPRPSYTSENNGTFTDAGTVPFHLVKRKAPDVKAIEIRAEVRQVRTMSDHSVNLILNLPEDCIDQAKVLLGWVGNEVKAVIETI